MIRPSAVHSIRKSPPASATVTCRSASPRRIAPMAVAQAPVPLTVVDGTVVHRAD